jgi:carboxylesterase
MGEHLAEEGYSVIGPRLFGHGTHFKDLNRSRWWDWVNSAMDGYYQLSDMCSHIFIVGLSMGGSISLLLGSRLGVDGVCAMAAPHTVPIKYSDQLRPFVPVLSKVWRYSKRGASDWQDKQAEMTHSAYDRTPVRAGAELYDLLVVMRDELPNLTIPLKLIYSSDDRSIPLGDAQKILDSVASSDKNLIVIEGSGHNVTRDAKRDEVFHLTSSFIDRVMTEKA